MQITKTTHPPAGATALLVAVNREVEGLSWYYLPVILLSSTLVLVTALISDNIQRRYPVFWIEPTVPVAKKPLSIFDSSQESKNNSGAISPEDAVWNPAKKPEINRLALIFRCSKISSDLIYHNLCIWSSMIRKIKPANWVSHLMCAIRTFLFRIGVFCVRFGPLSIILHGEQSFIAAVFVEIYISCVRVWIPFAASYFYPWDNW